MVRRGRVVALVFLIVVVVAAALVYRNGVHPKLVLWIVKQSWDRTRDFDAHIEAETEALGFRISGQGRLRYMKPNLYDLDFNTVRVIAGSEALWVVVPVFKTGVRVTAEQMAPAAIIGDLITGWDAADPAGWAKAATSEPPEITLYAPTVIQGERCWVLEWPSRTGERIGGRLYVSQRSRAPIRFDQMNSGGQVTHTYKVTDFRRNVGLTAKDFDYKPLAGYSTLDYRYDPRDPQGLDRALRGGNRPADDWRRRLEAEAEKRLPPEAADWLKRKGL